MQKISETQSEAFEETARIQEAMWTTGSASQIAKMQTQMRAIEEETRRRVSELAESSAIPISDAARNPPLQSTSCPHCSEENLVSVVPQIGRSGFARCKHCKGPFHVNVTANGIVTRKPGSGRWVPDAPIPVTDLTAEATTLLRRYKVLVPASALVVLARETKRRADALSTNGLHSPYHLQADLMDRSAALDLTNSSVRIFLKVVYQSGTFQFGGTGISSFKSNYINNLTEKDLVCGYIHGCLFRLCKHLVLDTEHAGELERLLLDGKFEEGEEWMTQEILEVKRMSSARPGTSATA